MMYLDRCSRVSFCGLFLVVPLLGNRSNRYCSGLLKEMLLRILAASDVMSWSTETISPKRGLFDVHYDCSVQVEYDLFDRGHAAISEIFSCVHRHARLKKQTLYLQR